MYIYSEAFKIVVYISPHDVTVVTFWLIPGIERDETNTI